MNTSTKTLIIKTRNIVLLGCVAGLLGACIPSVNPFYSEKDVIFDAGLLGEWSETESSGSEIWKFEEEPDRTYKFTITEECGKTGEFTARLFRLKKEMFLDLVPSSCEYATNQADVVASAMFPGHLLARVSQIQPTLKMAFFDFDWLSDYLKANPGALAHRTENKQIVLTADTRQLQRFILKHLEEDTLFKKPGEMSRKSGKVTEEQKKISKLSE